MRATAAALLLLLAAAPLVSAAANAPAWAEPYERGVAAAQRGAWSEAADALQKAIAAKGQEELSAQNGAKVVNYLPHYWLGVAQLNLGNTQAALSSLKRSESQGAIQRTDQYAAFRRALASAQAAQPATDAKAQRKPGDDAIARAVVAQTVALGAGASRRPEYQLADRKLEQALASMKGTPSAAQIQSATKLADEATRLYESVSKAPPKPPVVVKRGTPPVKPPVVEPENDGDPALLARIESEIRQLESAAAQGLSRNNSPQMKAAAESVNRSADAWRAEIGTGVPDERLSAISVDIARKLRDVAAAAKAPVVGPGSSTGPPGGTGKPPEPPKPDGRTAAQLRSAFAALTNGNLGESERILDELITNGGGVGAAYALRGCVRYTRALLGESQALVGEAQSDFRTAIRMDPAIRLDGRYFSPKLVALFDETRRQR